MIMQNSQPNDSSMSVSGKDKSIKKNSTYDVSNSLFSLKPSDLNIDNLLNHQIKNMDNTELDKMILQKRNSETKSIIPDCGVAFASKSVYTNKYLKHPHSKRKSIPVAAYIPNNSAKVVLRERSIEIKDLESKVKYLQNKIKEFEKENRTLYDIMSKQEKELKKFKEGVADIPSLLKSHKEETKVLESTVITIRKELRDCRKEVKNKNEIILKKDHQIEKLNTSLRLHDKSVKDVSNELKEVKKVKMELETENRKLLEANENFKFENGDLQDKIKEMVYRILNLEENLVEEKNLNKQQTRANEQLQLKFEELKNEVSAGVTGSFPDEFMNHNLSAEESSKNFDPVLSQICLKSENKELKRFPVIEELQVSAGMTASLPDECIDDDLIAEESSQNFAPILSQTCSKSENEVLERFPVMQESQEKAFDGNSVNKVKEALLHTFKRYHDMCMNESSNECITPRVATFSNLKSLPPLKGLRKNSQILNKKCTSLINKKFRHKDNMVGNSGELSKEHYPPLNVYGFMAGISKNRRVSTESDLVGAYFKQSDESAKHCSEFQFPVSWLDEL